MFSIKTTINSSLVTLPEQIKRAEDVILIKLVNWVYNDSLKRVPRKTGDLANSARIEFTAKKAKIIYDKRYAIYVEGGTSKMGARPYLAPALYSAPLDSFIADALKDALG